MRTQAFALLCALAIGWGNIGAAVAAVPLEVFGRLPSIEDVAISPDGTRLAFTRTTTEERVVYRIDEQGLAARR